MYQIMERDSNGDLQPVSVVTLKYITSYDLNNEAQFEVMPDCNAFVYNPEFIDLFDYDVIGDYVILKGKS